MLTMKRTFLLHCIGAVLCDLTIQQPIVKAEMKTVPAGHTAVRFQDNHLCVICSDLNIYTYTTGGTRRNQLLAHRLSEALVSALGDLTSEFLRFFTGHVSAAPLQRHGSEAVRRFAFFFPLKTADCEMKVFPLV